MRALGSQPAGDRAFPGVYELVTSESLLDIVSRDPRLVMALVVCECLGGGGPSRSAALYNIPPYIQRHNKEASRL